MYMKKSHKIIKFYFSLFLFFQFWACQPTEDVTLRISTDYGDIDLLLYNETEDYKENFIKLVEEGFYNDLLFHRVLPGQLIQGGDPQSKGAVKGKYLGQNDVGYQLKPDFRYVHTKGAIAAARTSTNNPQKLSSGSQFYIVLGQSVTDAQLDKVEQEKGFKYTIEQRKLYKLTGGSPQYDHDYSVFGEVIDGLDVVEKIAGLRTDPNQRPVEDVKMTITRLNPKS